MNYININNKFRTVKFEDAINCNHQVKGLIMPQYIPELGSIFIDGMKGKTNTEIATDLLYPFLSDVLQWESLKKLIAKSINFKFPLVQVEENIFALELFHGPTMAFKDVGASFLSSLLQAGNRCDKKRIIVATSGDTGSAVARAFSGIEGFEVFILYPRNGISNFQEQQITNMRSNVTAIEVDGSFDDCQHLLKSVLQNRILCRELNITTANSINIFRLLPQIVYYFLAYKQLTNKKKDVVFSVPSGNLGNLAAGIIAMKMGLPVRKFVAAVNQNLTFYNLLKYGLFQPNETVKTYSNAMDVGNPSNIDRILFLYGNDLLELTEDIECRKVNDEQTLSTIRKVYLENNYLLDPHSAVAYHALKSGLKSYQNGIFLATASPQKFGNVIEKALPGLGRGFKHQKTGNKISIANDPVSLKKILYGITQKN